MSELGDQYRALDSEWDSLRFKAHNLTATEEEVARERKVYRQLCSLVFQLEMQQNAERSEESEKSIEDKLQVAIEALERIVGIAKIALETIKGEK